jgi:hypothetical protein
LALRTVDVPVTSPAVGAWVCDSEAARTPLTESLSNPLPVRISLAKLQARVEDASNLATAAYRITPPLPCQIRAEPAGAPVAEASVPCPVLPRVETAPLAPRVPAAPAAAEQIGQSSVNCAPIAIPALAQSRVGIRTPVLPEMPVPEPAGLLGAGMPEAVPAAAATAAESAPVSFAAPLLRKPRVSAAPDRLALAARGAIREEVFGADVADAPADVPVSPSLGALSVLPALASLFRYGRPARPAAPLPHMAENLGLSPRNRRPASAAYMELPMPAQRPVVPSSTGLRIVETFEYQKPLEEPPFDLWQSLMRFWRTTPVSVRFSVASACLMLLFWVYVPGGRAARLIASRWDQIQAGIQDRAAIELSEDFRGDMAEWEGDGDWTRTWQKSSAGFVRPGRLALYQPSMQMQEYRVEFLMQIEKTAVGWAYRATDRENYYATKITIVKPGPLPALSLVRYPVIGGREGPRVEVPIRVLMHNNTPYRVQLTVSGDGFSTAIEGQLVDFWRDDRLKIGGFGFFGDTGESARVYWMKLSHQNDFIGRVCAYFRPAPVHVRSAN